MFSWGLARWTKSSNLAEPWDWHCSAPACFPILCISCALTSANVVLCAHVFFTTNKLQIPTVSQKKHVRCNKNCQDQHSWAYFSHPHHPPSGKVLKLEIKLEKIIETKQHQWKTTWMEEDLNGRQPQWMTTTMEDNHNWRRPQWKTISMEDDINGAL